MMCACGHFDEDHEGQCMILDCPCRYFDYDEEAEEDL